MSRLPTAPPTITTFVVRFWREWSGSDVLWRGRVEHVESGRRIDFMGVQELWGFLERFGIGADAAPASSGGQVAGPAATTPASQRVLPERRARMAKVYSLHMIALKAGADGPAFERFFHEELAAVPGPGGLVMRLLRGDRGDREGKYLVMFEFDSVERRDQLFPEAGPAARQMSGEVIQWMGSAGAILAKWNDYTTPFDTIYTDYREV